MGYRMGYCLEVLLAATLLVGCSGTLTSTNLNPADVKKLGWSTEGVVIYPQAWFFEYFNTTILVKDGKVIGREVDKTCSPVPTQRLALHADYTRPILLAYRPGLLETYKFGLTLSDEGVLKSVNIESKPDQGETLKNLGSAATSFAALDATPGAPPPCNDGPTLTRLQRVD